MRRFHRILCFLLAVTLCCTMAAAASGENTADVYELKSRQADVNPVSGVIALSRGNDWQLYSPDGRTPLSDRYDYISLQDQLFVVRSKNGQDNCRGLLDENGKELMPAQYSQIITISDRWNAGIVSKPGTAEQFDLYGFDNELLLIDRVDIFYRGSLCGSLDRTDWSAAAPYGDYLEVTNREGRYVWYNKELRKSPLDECIYREYSIDYRDGEVIHQGSGQKAFTEECTLQEDEVGCSLYYRDGEIVDLQGKVVCCPEDCEAALEFSKGNLIWARKTGQNKYGLIDRTGKQVVPCIYDFVDTDTEAAESCGYVYAERDGKGGFVNTRTGEETGFEFAAGKCKRYSGFFTVTDLDGNLIVTCAGAGKLSDHYTDIIAFSIDQRPVKPSDPPAILKDTEGRYGVIDINGNWIMEPGGYDWEFTDSQSMTYDGSVFLMEKTAPDLTRTMWSCVLSSKRQKHEDAEDSAESIAPASEEAPAPQPAEAADTWTCENGHEGNTGKFCTECGAPKPTPAPAPAEAAGTWTCENGHEGNTGKFCAECGAPRPSDEGPWTCSNGHEGNTGKFCTECGEPRTK